MDKITKKIMLFDVIIIFLFFNSCMGEGFSTKKGLILYFFVYALFFFEVIRIIYNRREIVEKSKFPVLILIINVFILNVGILSLLVWEISRNLPGSFEGINNIWDAVYFTIVSFSTVGYGDILPISSLAKGIVILTIFSNIMLLVVFVNFFIMRSKKKENYLKEVIWNLFFMFEQISSECGVLNEEYKKSNHTWLEWIDIFIDILQKNQEENPDKARELLELLERDREYNRQISPEESVKEIPYRYINGRDQLLISDFVYNCEKVIKEIEVLEENKIMLLENENLSERVFFILEEMKQNLGVVSRDYRYERTTAFKMMEAWKKDLYKQLNDLGYGELANVSFCGYNTDKSTELILALSGMKIESKTDILWMKVFDFFHRLMKL